MVATQPKQNGHPKAAALMLNFFEKFGAGEAIRTLDPNLGKVVLYP